MSTNLRAPGGGGVHVDGSGRTVALVCGRFNDLIVERLERGARRTLVDHGVSDADIATYWVPGALEVPQAVKAIADAQGDTTRSLRSVRSCAGTPITSRWCPMRAQPA